MRVPVICFRLQPIKYPLFSEIITVYFHPIYCSLLYLLETQFNPSNMAFENNVLKTKHQSK